MGEFPDQRIDLAQRERRCRMPFDVAPHEAVVGDGPVEIERAASALLDDRGAGGPRRVA